ncbi:phiSA1p31-related protein [Streptomyces violarus]|uniref:phiSA1p31-related protein n=1 Tax=Streptomyces violarus TaxID=67380 RepID=UPI0021BF2B65|nr:phiSA1p31-related protein [Streptomyces violarus]MCT9139042.1 phiSA1p31-related protein [Streptomyces violarus]
MSHDDELFAHARLVDFTEHPLVLLVDTEGGAELLGEDTMCPIQTAAILRTIAADLLASHPLGPCAPVAEAPAWSRPPEPLHPFAGTLDRARKVWTDGTGHVWDLSVPWADANGDTWRWHGVLDQVSGAPILRCDQWKGAHTLDVLREGRGPIRPVVGGAA